MTLTKTCDLDPQKSYILGCHPHGIFGISMLCSFGTDALGFRELFPGIDRRLITLPVQFRIPLVREITAAIGCCSSSKRSIECLLR